MARDTALLAVHVDTSGPVTVCKVVGALDIATVAIFRESVEIQIRSGGDVVIDLSELTFCDSTGLGAIVGLYRLATAADGSLILRSPRPRVASVLAMTGVDQVITVEDGPVDAASG
jgi:anti-sigma B factor antagonist